VLLVVERLPSLHGTGFGILSACGMTCSVGLHSRSSWEKRYIREHRPEPVPHANFGRLTCSSTNGLDLPGTVPREAERTSNAKACEYVQTLAPWHSDRLCQIHPRAQIAATRRKV